MRNLCVRVDEETYAQVSQRAEERGVSLSDFMRGALHARCHNGAGNPPSQSPELLATLTLLRSQLQAKDMQLERKETQLEQFQSDLSEQSQRHDTIILQMTQQLDRTNLQLEDLRRRRGWWERWRRKA